MGEELLSLPTGKKMKIPSKPVGVSISKYHGLIWTEDGKLWGWGCKNLGLGLSEYNQVNIHKCRAFMSSWKKLIVLNQ